MKVALFTIFISFSSFIFAFDPIDYYPHEIPDFNMSKIEFVKKGIEIGQRHAKEAQTDQEKAYWYGYKDAFLIQLYYLDGDHIIEPSQTE